MKQMKSKNHEIKAKWFDMESGKWKEAKTLSNGVICIGKKDHRISAFTLKTKGLLWYRSYRKGSEKWGKRIFKYGTKSKEYSGNKKRSLTGIAIKCNKVAYVAHLMTKDIWLPIVYGDEYDLSDFQYGFAGDKKHAIDMIDIWRLDNMPNYSEPVNPVGTYNPCYMSNGGPGTGGTVANNYYNTCIWGSPTQTGANVLSNCVGQAQGRCLEVYMEIHPNYNPATLGTHLFATLNGQPDSWITRAELAGLTVVHEPRAGSVLVTNSHVAFVEKYVEGEGWWTSESGYGNTVPWHYWYGTLVYRNNRWESTFSYDGQTPDPVINGFILVPDVTPGPGPTPGPHRLGYDRRRRYRNC